MVGELFKDSISVPGFSLGCNLIVEKLKKYVNVFKFVILSEQSESKDLRTNKSVDTFVHAYSFDSAKVLRLRTACSAQDDIFDSFFYIFLTL